MTVTIYPLIQNQNWKAPKILQLQRDTLTGTQRLRTTYIRPLIIQIRGSGHQHPNLWSENPRVNQ